MGDRPETSLQAGDLLCFVDETGDEALSDPNHRVFGFGGIAVPFVDYARAVRDPWLRMKAEAFPDLQSPLHAAGSDFSAPQKKALARFYRDGDFYRFGAVLSASTEATGMLSTHEQATGALIHCLGKMREAFAPTRLAAIFERSQRGDPKLLQSLLKLQQGVWDAIGVRFLWKTLEKRHREAGLEVADFVAHSSGCQVRLYDAGQKHWRVDFKAIFPLDARGSAFMNIRKVGVVAVPTAPHRAGSLTVATASTRLGPADLPPRED